MSVLRCGPSPAPVSNPCSLYYDESAKAKQRANHVRTQQAIDTGAEVVAVACPFCIQMFEDGIPALQPDEANRMKTYDISELLEVTVVARPRARREREAVDLSGDD